MRDFGSHDDLPNLVELTGKNEKKKASKLSSRGGS